MIVKGKKSENGPKKEAETRKKIALKNKILEDLSRERLENIQYVCFEVWVEETRVIMFSPITKYFYKYQTIFQVTHFSFPNAKLNPDCYTFLELSENPYISYRTLFLHSFFPYKMTIPIADWIKPHMSTI